MPDGGASTLPALPIWLSVRGSWIGGPGTSPSVYPADGWLGGWALGGWVSRVSGSQVEGFCITYDAMNSLIRASRGGLGCRGRSADLFPYFGMRAV